jgi:hypothetical protein
MVAPTDIRQRAITLLEGLPLDQVTTLLPLLELLSQTPQNALVSSEEISLLQVIQHHLDPESQTRLTELRDRCEWGELTAAEHQELLRYEDQLEQQNVERLEALMKLSRLRKVDLITLNRQFKSELQPFHAT